MSGDDSGKKDLDDDERQVVEHLEDINLKELTKLEDSSEAEEYVDKSVNTDGLTESQKETVKASAIAVVLTSSGLVAGMWSLLVLSPVALVRHSDAIVSAYRDGHDQLKQVVEQIDWN